jgi:hypothetical protein
VDDGLFFGDCKEESFWDFRAFTDHLTRLLWATSQSLEIRGMSEEFYPAVILDSLSQFRVTFSTRAFPPSHEYKLPFAGRLSTFY